MAMSEIGKEPAFVLARRAVDRIVLLGVASVVLAVALVAGGVWLKSEADRAEEERRLQHAAKRLLWFAEAFKLYRIEHGVWPAGDAAGVVPWEMVGRLSAQAWSDPTPGDGQWRWRNDEGSRSAVIVMEGARISESGLARIDALVDDGDPATGVFQRAPEGYPVLLLER